MVETLVVSVSGPAFSLLLYENVRSSYDQEGFLLGEIVEKETNAITDNDEQITRIDRIIKVNSAIPCPKICYFYNGAGKIDKKKIANFLGEQILKVVAWYKFKHIPGFKLTVREKVVHKQLASFFGSDPELFSCCLLTTDCSTNGSTHLYSQSFIRYNQPSYQMLPMHIVNLSDSNSTYKSPEPSSETFNNITKSFHMDRRRTQGLNLTSKIQAAVQKHIDQVVINLSDSEKQMYDLEEEVRILRENKKVGKCAGDGLKEESCESTNDTLCVENGGGDDIGFDSSPMNSKEPSPELKRKNCRSRKQNKNTRNSASRSPIKSEICSDNIVDNKTRTKSYSQAAQKSKN